MKYLKTALALLAAVLLTLALAACQPPGVTIITPPAPPPPNTGSPPPVGLTGPVLAALYDGATVRLWDGTNAVAWKTGTAVHGNGRKIAVGRTLYFLDASGAVSQSMNLPASPAGVAVVGDPVVYTFEPVDPQYALDHGALYRPYTRVWKNGIEDSAWPWMGNQWTYTSSFTADDGDVVVVDSNGHYWDIMHPELTGANGYQNIAWAWDGGPIFYFPDIALNAVTVYDASHPGGHAAVWSGGNIGVNWGPATVWTLWTPSGGTPTYYDGYGDSWDGTTLSVRASAMSMWNAVPSLAWCQANGYTWPQSVDRPRMLAAYQDAANMYWIECNTGLLVSWTPQTGVVAKVDQIYAGDGKAATGDANLGTLQPELVAGAMYFHQAGTLWQMDTGSTVISSFSADQQMWVMK